MSSLRTMALVWALLVAIFWLYAFGPLWPHLSVPLVLLVL